MEARHLFLLERAFGMVGDFVAIRCDELIYIQV